ncbi:YfbM family protein [Streptomyces sp. NBC_01537]|uniref:YfbM family protein n=1 Tax=Streptomyces sp. NBC_01537 TaxID=2903896 RepID=UPI003867093A
MAGRAVLFALETQDAQRLLAAGDDDELTEIVEDVEERWDDTWLTELDKSWDALHRCLTDGTLTFEGGTFPLSHAILGGLPLHEGDDYIVCYTTPEEVREIAEALAPLDEHWLRERFTTLAFPDYQGIANEEDIAYTQAFLPGLKDFYHQAAQAGRAAIFTVGQ